MSGARDLVVVGAGVGGLTAAALAAHDGLDVLVLEAHQRVGGCAGDFWKRGVLLPAGATLVSGFEPGGLHDQVYHRLGIVPRVVPMRSAMSVVLPDRVVDVSTDWATWDEEWRRAFPGHAAAKARFWREVRTLDSLAYRLAARQPALPPRRLSDLLRVAPALRPQAVTRLWALWRTVRDLAERTGAAADPAHTRFLDAQLLISMQCASDACVALNGALALSLYRHGCFYPEGGPGAVAADLAAALEAAGGALRERAAAVAVRRAGAGWRVTLDDGEQVWARQVVLNVSAWSVPDLLGEDCPPPLRVRRLPVGWGAVMVHGVVEAPAYVRQAPLHSQVVGDYARPLPEVNSCFVSFLPGEGRALGRAVLAASTHTDPRRWELPDRESYEAQRAAYRERLLAAAERVLPGVASHLRYVDCATPRTFARFTGRPWGMVGGLPQTREWANFRALSHRGGLPGLYLVGDTVFPGAGTIGVTLSGVNAYRDAVQAAGARVWPFARWPRARTRATGRVDGAADAAPRAA